MRRTWQDARFGEAVGSIWPDALGDFHQTLLECESLLARQGFLRNGRQRVLANFQWWLSAEVAADNLMARLKWHITRAEFYAKPSELEGIVKNGRDLQQLRREIANLEREIRNPGVQQSTDPRTDIVSAELKAKFERQFTSSTPSWIDQGSDWPLKEGLETLFFYFAR